MDVQTEEKQDKNKTEIEPGEKKDEALELARQVAKGEVKLADIKDESLVREFHQRFAIDAEEIPEDSDKKEEGPSEEKKEPDVKKPDESKEEDPVQEFRQKRKEGLDELNSIDQKIQSKQKQLEKMAKLNVEPQQKKYDDLLSEETVQSLTERLAKIEGNQKTFYDGQASETEKLTQDLHMDKTFLEIQLFQNENSFHMSKPLKTADAQYKKFIKDIGGLENVDKFHANKEYREQKESEGLVFPMSEKDYGTYTKIINIHSYKKTGKYPTLSSAYADYAIENGIVQDQIKQAAIKASEETLDKISGNDSGATMLSPEDGKITSESGKMSQEEMAAFIARFDPTTSNLKEQQKMSAIHKLLHPT